MGFSLLLTPHGKLLVEEREDVPALAGELEARLRDAFDHGTGAGLLQLGAGEVGVVLPPALAFWRDFGQRYVTAVCSTPDVEEQRGRFSVPLPGEAESEELVLSAPIMTGAEYLDVEMLARLWEALGNAFCEELVAAGESVQEFLKGRNPAWNLVGRVHFNLAENRKDEAAPFAFLATYTDRLSAHARAQHLPLGQALRQYAGGADRARLLNLLVPVQRAAESCPWLRKMVERGEIFHPLRWSPREAFQFLADVPALEGAGVVVRVPAGWSARRPPRVQVKATVGGRKPSVLGGSALLDFELGVSIGDETLTAAEVEQLLSSTAGLSMIRGRWVEVDPERLRAMLDRYKEIQRTARREGIPFAEALRLLSGADVVGAGGERAADPEWSTVVAGPWLAKTLRSLRSPEALADLDAGADLKATLRPYQQVGVGWLYLLAKLGLGACLADDMGLGKTIQVLALLLVLKRQAQETHADGDGGDGSGSRPANREHVSAGGTCSTARPATIAPERRSLAQKPYRTDVSSPALLVAPASLLANWASEIERFAPGLFVVIAHPSFMKGEELKAYPVERLTRLDLVITSYGSLLRLDWLSRAAWSLVVLDEAQAIKNPDTKQTRAVKKLDATVRFALTGTPVENRLSDLWSIFDFINPGLLGSGRQFASFTKRLAERKSNPYGPLRDLVRPYILRRLKTDRSVIADLPDKTEMKAFCYLTKRQAVLYQQAVAELKEQLESLDGIQRKGVVLASLMRFKQICNHPSQWLGDGAWAEADSGKWARLREIAEVIAGRQEKVLVFTQFREVIAPLASFLGAVFGRPGLVLHGETDVGKRKGLVQRFQEDESIPFFILSLKAGGSGLNLTAASHVVHFDRWWNPAVENQATDRAFRIGQTRNVLVHKFVCRGTVEDKIDALIESKRQLSTDLLEGGAEVLLTEMADAELLGLVALDIRKAMQEG